MNKIKKFIKKISPREKIMIIFLFILLLILILKIGIRSFKSTGFNLYKNKMAELDDRIYMVNNYKEEEEKLNKAIRISREKKENLERKILDPDKLDDLILKFFSSTITIEEYRISDSFDQDLDGINYEVFSLSILLNGNFQDIYLLLSDMEENFSNIEFTRMDIGFLENNSCHYSIDLSIFLRDESIYLEEDPL